MTDKKKPLNLMSPKGKLKWPKIKEPDYGTDQYPDPDGSFKTKILFDRKDPTVQPFLDKIDAALEEAREMAEEAVANMTKQAQVKLEKKGGITADDPYGEEYDKDGEPTGMIEMAVKRKASGISKRTGKPWKARLSVFDAKGKKMTHVPDVWSGSVARVGIELRPYFVEGTGRYGVQRSLDVVKLIQLVSGGDGSSKYDMEAEDGYDGDDYNYAAEQENDESGDAEGETLGAGTEGGYDF